MGKRSSMLSGIIIGILSVLLVIFAVNMLSTPYTEVDLHHHVWQGHGMMLERGMHHETHYGMKNAVHTGEGLGRMWSLLLQLAVLVGGAVLFAKGKGILKWTGAVFAAFCIMSLMTPFWGIVVLIAVYLLYRRITGSRKNTAPKAGFAGMLTPMEMSESRGAFLDEGERNQHKEEK